MADTQLQPAAAETARRPAAPITKACDLCRKKKIRCQPMADGCVQCTRAKVANCHFTPIAAMKKPRLPPGHKHIAMLEERLRRMEGLLQDALGKNEPRPGWQPGGEAESLSFDEQMLLDPSLLLEGGGGSGGDMSMMQSGASSMTDPGPASGSRDPSTSASAATGSDYKPPIAMMEENLAMLTPPPSTMSWKGMLALGPFSLPSFHPLPAQHVAFGLVEDAFAGFNDFYPLFDRDDFYAQFYANYARSHSGDPGWWATINTVLSLAHRLRAMRAADDDPAAAEEANEESCGHIHNALAVVSELLLLHDSLIAVQALVGIAAVLQGTPNPHSASVLTTSALRLAQGMGFHRKTSRDASLSAAQYEQRRRVFWIAYCLDKDISLRTGQPFAQDDDDMDPELPPAVRLPHGGGPAESAGRMDASGLDLRHHDDDNNNKGVYTFHARIGLAVIQGQIYKKLYSVQASRQSAEHRAEVAQELTTLLLYWKNSVSIDGDTAAAVEAAAGTSDAQLDALGSCARLCGLGSSGGAPHTAESLHKLILRFTYVNCLAMIDAHLPPPAQQQQQQQGQGQGQFEGRIAIPESICIVESRRAMALVQGMPQGDFALVWVLLRPLFSAITALLNNAIRNPAGVNAPPDLALVDPAIELLGTLAGKSRTCSRSQEARHMHPICEDLRSRAEEAMLQVDCFW